jgi:hypothetical protein
MRYRAPQHCFAPKPFQTLAMGDAPALAPRIALLLIGAPFSDERIVMEKLPANDALKSSVRESEAPFTAEEILEELGLLD